MHRKRHYLSIQIGMQTGIQKDWRVGRAGMDFGREYLRGGGGERRRGSARHAFYDAAREMRVLWVGK